MRSSLKYILLLILPMSAWADLTIFDVRKNLAMSNTDPVYRDYIINGGSESGLSVGMLVNVQRRLPLYDSYQNRSAGDLHLKVARIKIIHVQKGLAVARLQSEFTREATPILEDNFIMVGDQIDLSSAGPDKAEKKADSGAGGGGGSSAGDSSKASTPEAPPAPEPVAAASAISAGGQTTAQIVVNTIDLSSKPAKSPSPAPEKVEVPVLQ
jgi:hypothetical protein